MTVAHHPPEDLLAKHATGALEEAEHLVVAVHVASCARCGRFVQAMERLAGAALEDAAPAPMAADVFNVVMARIEERPAAGAVRPLPVNATAEHSDIPELLRHYRIGKRRRVAPGVSMQPIELSGAGKARAFLL